jgi:hypothetical protein
MEKRRMWTKPEIQFVRDNAGKIPSQQIADILTVRGQAIVSGYTLGPVGSCSISRRA